MNVYIWKDWGLVVVAKNEKRAVALVKETGCGIVTAGPDHIIACGPREDELILCSASGEPLEVPTERTPEPAIP